MSKQPHGAALDAVRHAREGNGPVFLLANTYRLTGHYVGDPQVYRPKDEVRQLRATQDPIEKLKISIGLEEPQWLQLEAEIAEVVDGSGRVCAERHRSPPRRRAGARLR